MTLADVRGWADQLTGKPGTRRRKLTAVKSLLTFGETTGYLPFNVGRAVKLPQDEHALAERILSPVQTHRLLAAAGRWRDRVLLLVLYASGGRVSELCGLRWSHTAERSDGEEGLERLTGPLVQHVAADGVQRARLVQVDDTLGA